MKKEYIKPTILGVYAQTEKNLMNIASQYDYDDGTKKGFVTENNTEEGGEAEGAAAKDFNAWSKWDD